MVHRSAVKNIIFDLGGVIINIDPGLTLQGFQEKYSGNFLERFKRPEVQELLHGFETGKYDEYAFQQALMQAFEMKINPEEFTQIWNRTLLDTPLPRLELLQQLKGEFRIFLLSNTNPTHMNTYFNQIADDFQLWFPDLFEKAYLSYNMDLRKPDPEIFKAVLDEQGLKASESLFLDDTLEHLQSAQSLGIHTYQVTQESPITTLLNENWR